MTPPSSRLRDPVPTRACVRARVRLRAGAPAPARLPAGVPARGRIPAAAPARGRIPVRARGLAAAIPALLLLVGCTPDPATGTPGAQSAGDPLFPRLGNGGYDVSHYRLRLDYDVRSHRLDATAVVTAKATQDLRSFSFDLSGMTVRSVSVDGRQAHPQRAREKLIVHPAETVAKGATFRTTVAYRGEPRALTDPDGSTEGWVPTDDGAFVSGEPAGAMTWFPGNNHPSDKASYDVTITVPEGWTAVANGELRGQRTHGGRTTFRWHDGEPMASYLATATIGKFDVSRSKAGGGLPLYVAVDPREAAASRKVLAGIGGIIDWETGLFGPYPFSSAGAIVDHKPRGVDYALEVQTKPLFPGTPDQSTLVHELAHEWYGDSVTPKSWRDMWLNEGFATYTEWLWQERHGGDSAQKTFDTWYAKGTDDPVWAFPPGDPGRAENVSGDPVYERGAMALHELRATVGDGVFFRILKEWPAAYRYRNVDTADFVAFCEQRAHRDLSGLFHTWLYADGKPDRSDLVR